jgi:hypothetical protein
LRSNGASLPWTSKEVPLFHLTLWIKAELIDNSTCNWIQAWIIRQFWLKAYPATEFEIKSATL